MKILRGQILTGQLFSWKKDRLNWSDLPRVSVRSMEAGWSKVTFSIDEPLLLGEDLSADEFSYEYYLRMHGEHVILVSNHFQLVEAFIRRTNLLKSIRKPSVEVDRLVKELSKKPHALYTISRVYADVEGHGRKFRSVSLFGDDLVDVLTFQQLLPVLVAHRAELRNIRRRMNVLCVDIEGAVEFQYRGESSLKLMVEALSFLSTGVVKLDGVDKEEIQKMDPFIRW